MCVFCGFLQFDDSFVCFLQIKKKCGGGLEPHYICTRLRPAKSRLSTTIVKYYNYFQILVAEALDL